MRINSVLPTALLVAALVAPSFAGAQAAGANPKPPRKPAPSSVAAKASVPSAAHTAAVDPVAKGMEKSDGKAVKGAKRAAAAKSISATCNDGSSYMGATRSGACSRHGGVKGWADGSAPGVVPFGATALCTDGTYFMGKGRRGACTGHRGVKKWLVA